MNSRTTRVTLALGVAAAALVLASAPVGADQDRPTGQGFSFRTGVELINVTATVTDDTGRFVSGLTQNDFEVYEDGKLQTISQFDSERVPVSLGIALDTSGSMLGEKIAAAQAAVNRFLYDLLGPDDEVFLYRFDSRPQLIHGWTEDRRAVGRMLGNVRPNGGTAMYDAVAVSVPLAQSGTRRKKALVLISDGNDTSSQTSIRELQQLIRETEVLVYAIGIDASGNPAAYYQYGSGSGGSSGSSGSSTSQGSTRTAPVPSPFPGRTPPPAGRSGTPPITSSPPSSSSSSSSSSSAPPPSGPPSRSRSGPSDRMNVDALRVITDDSGGRTEIIVSPRDLDPATAGIANELSRQYFIGYSSSLPKDGRWHTIEVRVKRANVTVRARRGFIAN
jgi:VWFA-related protein